MFQQQDAQKQQHLGHPRVWDPCNQKNKAEFSPRYNSIGLPLGTRVCYGKVIPNKPRVMEPIDFCKAKAISRWTGEPMSLPLSPVAKMRGGARTTRQADLFLNEQSVQQDVIHVADKLNMSSTVQRPYLTQTARSPVGYGSTQRDKNVFKFPATSHASSRYGSRGMPQTAGAPPASPFEDDPSKMSHRAGSQVD